MENKYLEKFKLVHGDRYDYSLFEFINLKTKIKIKCSEHGIFEQSIYFHAKGQGCPKCKGKSKRKSNDKFIEQGNKIHNFKYDYSLVNYIDGKTDVIIICPIHGQTIQKPDRHLQTKGCRKCGDNLSGVNSNLNEFIVKAKIVHGDKYSYLKSNYIGNNDKLIIICDLHGDFNQTPHNHLKGHGCPHCRESKGEKEIKKILIENKINFSQQKKFSDCKHILQLPFDFYLSDYNICIEFNGRQHYKPVSIFGGLKEFDKVKLRDKIKIEYCQNNNIKLLIIKHDDNLKIILNQFLLHQCIHN